MFITNYFIKYFFFKAKGLFKVAIFDEEIHFGINEKTFDIGL